MRCGVMEKNLIHQGPGKSFLCKKETRSKQSSSLHSKTGCKLSYTKRCKPKPKSHVKTIGSIPSKRRVSGFSRNGARNNSTKGKSIRRVTVHRALDTKSSEKQSSSRLLCEKSSLISCKRHEDDDSGDERTQKMGKKRKRKNRKETTEIDEASRLRGRTRYLMIKMKLEQNLIDAYSGEGWKGQSREKIKPEKELQRAKKQILKCKLGIRDAIRQLELLSSVGCIEDSVIAADGSVYHEHIFCAKCKLRDAFPDNDIILCDGTCNCAFHQKCLEPPLATENIPPGDQGWFCKFCDCKMEILGAMNAHLGTNFSTNSSWQDIFKEASVLPGASNASLKPEEDWPSDDSEDDDYDPKRNETSSSHSRAGTEDYETDDTSCSSGLLWSLGEDSLISGRSDNECSNWRAQGKSRSGFDNHNADSINGIDSGDAADHDVISCRRQRKDVDYKKLHDEMFGKDTPENEHVSEDEDWGPGRRKRRQKESDAASTLMTLCENERGCANAVLVEEKKKFPSFSQDRKRLFRIPPNVVEKLRQVFAEDELPSKAVRDGLSKQLGLASEKVNKWFKNARYTALKMRKAENRKQLHGCASILTESSAEPGKNQNIVRLPSNSSLCMLSSATRIRITKNVKKVHRRKNSKSIITPSKKTQHKGAVRAISSNINEKNREDPRANQSTSKSEKQMRPKRRGSSYDQVDKGLSCDVSLKKLFNDLKRKSAMGKKVKSNCKGGTPGINETKNKEQLYVEGMERLCLLKDRVDRLKMVLRRMYNDENNVVDKSHEPLVIYVPIAEVKEKV